MFDYNDAVISELKKYKYLADKIESGDFSLFDYKPAYKKEWGSYDENAHNRKRLILYMTAFRTELITEEIIKRLFIAETESCHNNSFGGFGTALEMLTEMMLQYNKDGKYNNLFEKAKNANFDCFCGYSYEQGQYSFETGTDHIKQLTPEDCIHYMYYELSCEEKTISMLDIFEEENKDSPQKLGAVRYINECLDRKSHNYIYYNSKLDKTLESNDNWEISFCFSDLIDCCIDTEQDKAYSIFNDALPYLFKVKGWDNCGLGRNYMAYATRFALILSDKKIWTDWRDVILKHRDMLPLNDIKNYYIKASQLFNDKKAEKKLDKFVVREKRI